MEETQRGIAATTDAPAQLVQLTDAEILRFANQDDGGVGNVHADFDDRGGDQHVYFPAGKGRHAVILIVHAPVQHHDPQTRKSTVLQLFGKLEHATFAFDARANNIGLVACGDFFANALPRATNPCRLAFWYYRRLDRFAPAG